MISFLYGRTLLIRLIKKYKTFIFFLKQTYDALNINTHNRYLFE